LFANGDIATRFGLSTDTAKSPQGAWFAVAILGTPAQIGIAAPDLGEH